MARKTRKSIILAKVETTYATDATPTGSVNAMLVSDLDVRPFEAQPLERGFIKPYLGGRPAIHVGTNVVATFSVEMAGAGTAGDPAPYAALLLGCGMEETLVASTSAAYTPVSQNEDSLTIYYHRDGHRHKLTGARGTWDLTLGQNQYPLLRFTFTGIYNAPSAVADPTPVFSAFQTPLPSNSANTTFSLGGYSPCLAQLSLQYGNAVRFRDLIGCVGVEITDRATAGSLTIDEPGLASKDYYAVVNANSLVAFSLAHGTAAGNIVTIVGATGDGGVQLLQPTLADDQGSAQMAMNLSFVPSSAGNDEVAITLT